MIDVHNTYQHEFSFTQADVEKFAEVTGDNNPIHIDESYAAGTAFGRPIMHGFLGASIFSKVFGTLFPGNGTIYLKQSMSFKSPMYAGVPYVANFLVLSIDRERHSAMVKTEIIDSLNKIIITGEALLMHNKLL